MDSIIILSCYCTANSCTLFLTKDVQERETTIGPAQLSVCASLALPDSATFSHVDGTLYAWR